LEATRTLTGFAPEVLLMTSVYDTLFDEDLPGFLCVKTQFWDKGQSDVDVYIRRRTIEGQWLWLASRAVSFINDGEIPAIILEESRVPEEQMELVQLFNRVTRITAILIQAVEAAWLTQAKYENEANKQPEVLPSAASVANDVSLLEDTAAYQAVMDAISASGTRLPENVNDLQNLVQISQLSAAGLGVGSAVTNTSDLPQAFEQELMQNISALQDKAFDPNSVVESVRLGVRLDFGMLKLEPDEVKVIGLVLAGRIDVDLVAPLVLASFQLGLGMKGVAEQIVAESEQNSPSQQKGAAKKQLDQPLFMPPPISVLNLSYTFIGNVGVEMLSEFLCQENSCLSTLDVSFCGIDEKGMLTLARALARRVKKNVPLLRGLILTGNILNPRAALEIGCALSATDGGSHKRSRKTGTVFRRGYDSDDSESSDDDEAFLGGTRKRRKGQKRPLPENRAPNQTNGLQVLHVAHCSMTAETTRRLLEGLGPECPIRELNLSSNSFGVDGATALLNFLEPKQRIRGAKPGAGATMPFLDRLDMSNNNLGDDGTTQLTRAILVRAKVHLVDLRLSSNSIGSGGIETIMNKLLQHNLVSLSLDNNNIGDQGCQLVAASLQTMQSLSRLNLGFNRIGCRGITSLMRSLVTCKSMRYLGLSGNNLRVSGAIALAFTLSQHPRLEELDLDNCCLGQAAQCHIVAGIISNRWVPMKRLKGYALGPPMAAIGALKPAAVGLSNEECLRIRKDEQMKTILQWMETNRTVKNHGGVPDGTSTSVMDANSSQFLTPDFVSRTNDIHGTPSQNAYLRLLGWLSRIPFDEDELSALQMYFYESDSDGDRGSDGHINLKLRGDLLAALDEKAADEIREDIACLAPPLKRSVGADLDKLFNSTQVGSSWEVFLGRQPCDTQAESDDDCPNASNDTTTTLLVNLDSDNENLSDTVVSIVEEKTQNPHEKRSDTRSLDSNPSTSGKEKKGNKLKPRITLFPQFEKQLNELKASATEMLEQEDDPLQHEIILTQYAEASLTILRQLRYHCMNSGLDGWRQSGLTRKVLIVDDSIVTRKLVSRAFEKANFIVDTACNGAEGVEKLKTSLYDIAFMDIDMPVMNGFEATKRLREWEDVMRPGARQPICALTATYVDDFERSELMKFKDAGLDVMESKPCNIPRLFKVVDDVAPMFSDLSISVMQRERSDHSLFSERSSHSSYSSL
jgi:CheY-like chemotaxis protein